MMSYVHIDKSLVRRCGYAFNENQKEKSCKAARMATSATPKFQKPLSDISALSRSQFQIRFAGQMWLCDFGAPLEVTWRLPLQAEEISTQCWLSDSQGFLSSTDWMTREIRLQMMFIVFH